ncbi:sulfite exporter TauE/SafE family protein [Marinomonas flavescens]|uniref:sulfite exporter TauE/SafE family protein n=1 Tax=Marinomonas flavescens TaxID=2529379 RepID=UPI00105439AF|nr:sulfite exporter TauE/SafE family protein [Marinomonas flavescens]
MEIQFLVLLFIIGGVAGSLYATTKIPAPLFVIPVTLLFFPAVGFTQTGALLPIIATAITSFIPLLLMQWVGDMKAQQVDSQALIALSPGASMGGVIGAQIVSFMTPLLFKFSLSFVVLTLMISVFLNSKQLDKSAIKKPLMNLNNHYLRIPIGLFIGIVSVVAGGTGKSLGSAMLTGTPVNERHRDSTAVGLALFVSIAAMVGFSFPAKPFDYSYHDGFIGAIQLLSCLILAVSQLFFYLLCRNKGNSLDKMVLTIGLLLFIVIAVSRVWFMPL